MCEYARMEALRAAGRVRSEGREYVMQEGDVVELPVQRVSLAEGPAADDAQRHRA